MNFLMHANQGESETSPCFCKNRSKNQQDNLVFDRKWNKSVTQMAILYDLDAGMHGKRVNWFDLYILNG